MWQERGIVMKRKLLFIYATSLGMSGATGALMSKNALKRSLENVLGPDWRIDLITDERDSRKIYDADVTLMSDYLSLYVDGAKYPNVVTFPSEYLMNRDFLTLKQLVTEQLWKKYVGS